jgi:hypothetical protein
MSMTLCNMRANAVRSVLASCSNVNCRHESILNVNSLGDDVSVPSLGPQMRCQRYGQRGADMRPNWNEHAPPSLLGPRAI